MLSVTRKYTLPFHLNQHEDSLAIITHAQNIVEKRCVATSPVVLR